MRGFLLRMRRAAGAFALLACLFLACSASSPAGAQQRNPDNSVNPTASSVNEQQLLEQMRIISGRGTIPDVRSYNIIQPAGREWRCFRESRCIGSAQSRSWACSACSCCST
jgi:formate dehydrogenase subunit gamma